VKTFVLDFFKNTNQKLAHSSFKNSIN